MLDIFAVLAARQIQTLETIHPANLSALGAVSQ
jgi:hypothetical protein